MARRERLDVVLVRRGLARSREQAGALIAAGRVSVAGARATKAATAVAAGDALVVAAPSDGGPDYVSRGGVKLAAALDVFAVAEPPLSVGGLRCLDAGASTGGFTDVLLRRGAASIAAVDVGYGQLAWALRQDPRVRVLERTNIRSMTPEDIGGPVDLCVADLSFIGLPLVLPALAAATRPDGELVLLVKPQFEVGRAALGEGGVVREPALRAGALLAVAQAGRGIGLHVAGAVASPLPGPSGNVEYLLRLLGAARPAPAAQDDASLARLAADAVAAGPA